MKNKEYVSLVKMIEYIDKAIKYTENYSEWENWLRVKKNLPL